MMITEVSYRTPGKMMGQNGLYGRWKQADFRTCPTKCSNFFFAERADVHEIILAYVALNSYCIQDAGAAEALQYVFQTETHNVQEHFSEERSSTNHGQPSGYTDVRVTTRVKVGTLFSPFSTTYIDVH